MLIDNERQKYQFSIFYVHHIMNLHPLFLLKHVLHTCTVSTLQSAYPGVCRKLWPAYISPSASNQHGVCNYARYHLHLF